MRVYNTISRAIKALEADKRSFITPIIRRACCVNLEELTTVKEAKVIAYYTNAINNLRDLYMRVFALQEHMEQARRCNKTQQRCWNEINSIVRALRG